MRRRYSIEGTSHFPTEADAIKHYAGHGSVSRKIRAGEITIGRPEKIHPTDEIILRHSPYGARYFRRYLHVSN